MGLGDRYRFEDAIANAFVMVRCPAEEAARALGPAELLKETPAHPPEDLLGLVAGLPGSDWCCLGLAHDHLGVPRLYSDFLEEDILLPYDPEHYFPSMDLAAREGKVLDHPLCHYCPVTVAAEVTRATNSEGYAIWCLECFSLLGRSLLKNGEIQETISNGCPGGRSHRFVPSEPPQPIDGDLFDLLNEKAESKGIWLPDSPLDLDMAEQFEELWMVRLPPQSSSPNERWAEWIDELRPDLPL